VTDRGHRLALLEERAREADRRLLGAQVVGVGDSARKDQAVVITGIDLVNRPIGIEGVALVQMVEGLDLALLRSNEVDLCAGVSNGAQRLGELDLLDALVRDQKRNLFSLQLVSHSILPSLVPLLNSYPHQGQRDAQVEPTN
jgi:hypothetical protein